METTTPTDGTLATPIPRLAPARSVQCSVAIARAARALNEENQSLQNVTFDRTPLSRSSSSTARTTRKPTQSASVIHQMLCGRCGSRFSQLLLEPRRAALPALVRPARYFLRLSGTCLRRTPGRLSDAPASF